MTPIGLDMGIARVQGLQPPEKYIFIYFSAYLHFRCLSGIVQPGRYVYNYILLLIDRAIRRNWVMLDSLVEKYRMTQ